MASRRSPWLFASRAVARSNGLFGCIGLLLRIIFSMGLQEMATGADRAAPQSTEAKSSDGAPTRITKGELVKLLAHRNDLKLGQVRRVIKDLAVLAGEELSNKKAFVVPGVVRMMTREKPALEAGQRTMFGKTVQCKARAAKSVVKAFALPSFKRRIHGSGSSDNVLAKKPKRSGAADAKAPSGPAPPEPDADTTFCIKGFLHLGLNVKIGQNYTYEELKEKCKENQNKIDRLRRLASDESVMIKLASD